VRPAIAAANALGPPSRLVRAPSTLLAKLTALDSDQATWSRAPAGYHQVGVQVVVRIPMAAKAG
jgi:hypothetical protein